MSFLYDQDVIKNHVATTHFNEPQDLLDAFLLESEKLEAAGQHAVMFKGDH